MSNLDSDPNSNSDSNSNSNSNAPDPDSLGGAGGVEAVSASSAGAYKVHEVHEAMRARRLNKSKPKAGEGGHMYGVSPNRSVIMRNNYLGCEGRGWQCSNTFVKFDDFSTNLSPKSISVRQNLNSNI